jgi:hypothetical protein
LPTAPENLGDVATIESNHDRYLGPLRLPNCEVNVVPLMNKDSLEMTDPDRVRKKTCMALEVEKSGLVAWVSSQSVMNPRTEQIRPGVLSHK